MASNYNSLGFNLMTTGENAGTWGTNTNLNLNYLRDTMGYITVAMTEDRTLTIPDNSTGTFDGRAFIIECTGALGANRVLDIAATAGSGSSPGGTASILKPFIVFNNTSTSYTLTFKVTGATGFVLTQGSTYLCYHNGTDIINTNLGALTTPAGSTTEIQFNNSGTFGGSSKLAWDGTNVLIDADGALRLGDNTGSAYVGLQAPATITGDTAYTLKLPVATGAADQILVTDGSGNLSFTDNSGGTAWQTVVTAATVGVTAGNGYFINTTSNACTATLPASPTLGDEISFVDYAATFDTNNLTVARNGKNIQGSAADLTVATERAGFTLVFTDNTQGWLLKNN